MTLTIIDIFNVIMLTNLKQCVILISLCCFVTNLSIISGFLCGIEDLNGKADSVISLKKVNLSESGILSKNGISHFRLDPMNNHAQNIPKTKLVDKNKNNTNQSYETENISQQKSTELKTTKDNIQDLNNENNIKITIQNTYKKLAENFRKLEILMKKQEEVENKVKEEKKERVDGQNNIITIENVHSNNGNYTRVILSKRKITEFKHEMPLQPHQCLANSNKI